MDQHLLFGLACCVLLVVFFLMRGRKNDSVSWLVLLIGVAAIFVIIANWHTIAQWWPTTTAAHAAPVSTPAPLHASAQSIPVNYAMQPTVVPLAPAPSGTTHEAAVLLMAALGYGVAILLFVGMGFTIVALVFVRRNQPRRGPILHSRSTRLASSAHRTASPAK